MNCFNEILSSLQKQLLVIHAELLDIKEKQKKIVQLEDQVEKLADIKKIIALKLSLTNYNFRIAAKIDSILKANESNVTENFSVNSAFNISEVSADQVKTAGSDFVILDSSEESDGEQNNPMPNSREPEKVSFLSFH